MASLISTSYLLLLGIIEEYIEAGCVESAVYYALELFYHMLYRKSPSRPKSVSEPHTSASEPEALGPTDDSVGGWHLLCMPFSLPNRVKGALFDFWRGGGRRQELDVNPPTSRTSQNIPPPCRRFLSWTSCFLC